MPVSVSDYSEVRWGDWEELVVAPACRTTRWGDYHIIRTR
jgi:hypothetical protein